MRLHRRLLRCKRGGVAPLLVGAQHQGGYPAPCDERTSEEAPRIYATWRIFRAFLGSNFRERSKEDCRPKRMSRARAGGLVRRESPARKWRAMGRIEHPLLVRDIPLTDLRPPPANHTIPQKATDVSIYAFGAERGQGGALNLER